MSPTARVIYYLKSHRQGSQMFYTPQGNNSGYLWENFPMRLPDWRAKLIAVRVKRSRFASSVSILGFPKDFSILFLYLLLALDSKTKIYQALKKGQKDCLFVVCWKRCNISNREFCVWYITSIDFRQSCLTVFKHGEETSQRKKDWQT